MKLNNDDIALIMHELYVSIKETREDLEVLKQVNDEKLKEMDLNLQDIAFLERYIERRKDLLRKMGYLEEIAELENDEELLE